MGRIATNLDPAEIVGIRRSSDKKCYYAQTRDGRSRQLRSVTSALGVISKDEALLRWGIKLYSKCIEARAPVGETLTEDALTALIEAGSSEFERVRYDAAEVGNRAHSIISDWLCCREIPDLELEDTRVQNALKLFWDWWKGKGLRVVESEMPVFNAQHGYAGTLDFLCELPDGRLAIIDFKTGSGIYPEHYMQLAAYFFAITSMPEKFGGRKREDFAEAATLRIGKEDAYFEPAVITLDLLPEAYKGFYCCLQLQDKISTIKSVDTKRWKAWKRHTEELAKEKIEVPF